MLIIKNWGVKCALLLLLAMGLAGCMPAGPKALLNGQKLIEEGDFPNAVAKLQTATSLMPTNAAAWNYLGIALQHMGQSTNAEAAYLKALSLDRNLSEAQFNLGCLRLEEQRLDAAKSALISYTALRGNSIEGWLKLGTVQLRLRELAAAEKSFNEVLALDEKNPEALNNLGVIHLQRRDARQAAAFFNRALEAKPDYGPALLNLAVVNHVHLNNPAPALRNYKEYLALSDENADSETVLAIAASLEQQLNPAPATASTTREVEPAEVAAARPPVTRTTTNPPPRTTTQVARAADSSRSGADAAPTRTTPTDSPANAAATQPRTETPTNKPGILRQMNPMRLFRSDERTEPQSTASASRPSSTQATQGSTDAKALAAFPRYKYKNPRKPEAGDVPAARRVFQEGSRAHQGHRYDEALAAYQQATKLDPAFYEAYYNMALASLGVGNLSQALTAYESALAIRPDSLDARYNFAVALRQGNFIADAIREFENVLSRYPREARVHIALGSIYAQQLRNNARAKEHYNRALELDPKNPQAATIRYWLSSH